MSLRDDIAKVVKGDVADDKKTLTQYSPRHQHFRTHAGARRLPQRRRRRLGGCEVTCTTRKRAVRHISLAGRSAGTDMTGGPLTDSVSLVFTKYMNHIGEIGDDYAVAEPGVYYRDFEKATLAKVGKILPSYPASRELCAIGGIVSNNSGGELTLQLRQDQSICARTRRRALRRIAERRLTPISTRRIARKRIAERPRRTDLYARSTSSSTRNEAQIEAARPNVTKNSAGYALWNVMDKSEGTFDLTQLIVRLARHARDRDEGEARPREDQVAPRDARHFSFRHRDSARDRASRAEVQSGIVRMLRRPDLQARGALHPADHLAIRHHAR